MNARALLTLIACGCLTSCDHDDPNPNATPIAAEDNARTRPLVAVDIDVLANDSDPDGDPDQLNIELVGEPAHATASVSGRRVRVVPHAGFSGRTNFRYRARDGQGAVSQPTQVTIDVHPTTRVLMLAQSEGLQSERWLVADPTAVWQVAAHSTDCGMRNNFVRNASGTQVVIMTCGEGPRAFNLVSVRPRASEVRGQQILGNARIQGHMVLSEDGTRVVVLQFEEDPNLPAGVSNYALLAIDTASGEILRRLPVGDVEYVFGIRGAGSARVIFLQALDRYEDPSRRSILTADLEAGTIARLDLAAAPLLNIHDATPFADGSGLLFDSADERLFALDSQDPEVLALSWEDSAAVLSPVDVIPGSAVALVSRYDWASAARSYWSVPVLNPDLRQPLLPDVPALSGSFASRSDGRRMLYSFAAMAPEKTSLHEISIEDVSQLGPVGPADGIPHLAEFEYLGKEGDVLVGTAETSAHMTLSVIRRDQRELLVPLAGDLVYHGTIYRSAAADGTGVAFSVRQVSTENVGYRSYFADVNMPEFSAPLPGAQSDDENVLVIAALGAPLP